MTILCAMFFTLGMVFSANALSIDATEYKTNRDNDTFNSVFNFYEGSGGTLSWWYGYQAGVGGPNPELHSDPAIKFLTESAEELYKSNVGDSELGVDEQDLLASSWYTTTFYPIPDPYNATIEWSVNNPYIDGARYLFVKDGNADPVWYLFDIYGEWNGRDNIVLTNFWIGPGAISHVAIYGGTPVPEPGMVILLGIGLLGLAFYNRKRLLN